MKITDLVKIEVQWATSAGDFLPFTTLGKDFHGKTVAVITLEDLQELIDQAYRDGYEQRHAEVLGCLV